MFLNQWIRQVATRGCLIAFLVAAGPSYGQHKVDDTPQSRPSGQAQQLPTQSVLSTAAAEKEVVKPDWNNLNCAHAKSHDEADLCEQRRMANAAEQTVRLNWIQIGVAVVGFGLVMWNLFYVRKGTIASITAANAATVAAEAAKTSVEVASATAKTELRAYLGVKHGFVRKSPDDRVLGSIEIANQGQTPAHNVKRFVEMAILDVGHSTFEPPAQELGSWVIGPDAFWTLSKEIVISSADLAEISKKKKTIFLWGRVTYEDIHRQLRTTEFRYKLGQEVHEWQDTRATVGAVKVFLGWTLDPISEGNHST
jgi:hypothetical protein